MSAVFDIKTDGIALPSGVAVYPMSELASYCAGNKVDIAVIATPSQAAQSVADAAGQNLKGRRRSLRGLKIFGILRLRSYLLRTASW